MQTVYYKEQLRFISNNYPCTIKNWMSPPVAWQGTKDRCRHWMLLICCRQMSPWVNVECPTDS